MLYPTPSQWRSWGIEQDPHKLLLLLWVELFDGATLDTWQVRSSNIPSLLREIVHTATVAEEHPAFGYNVEHLIAEALAVASLDPVLPKHYPHLRSYLQDLSSEWKSHDQSSDRAHDQAADDRSTRRRLQRVRSLSSVMLGHLRTYRENLFAELRSAVVKDDPKEKERLVRLSMAYATELATTGYDTEYLRQGTGLLQNATMEFGERLDAMASCYSGAVSRFTCTFNVYGPPLLTRLTPDQIRFTKGRPEAPCSAVQEEFYRRTAAPDLFARVEVDALDPVSACAAAREKLANAFAALIASAYDKHFGVKGPLVLVEAPGLPEQVVLVAPSFTSHDASRARFSAQRAADLLSFQSILQQPDLEQFNAVLQYHRLALSAETDEVRLVNLWIALEGLVLRSTGGNIIDRVCSLIPSTIALGNVAKLTRGLAIYIREYWRLTGFEPFEEIFPGTKPQRLTPSDLLAVLLDEAEGRRINRLYELVDHPLIRYRIHRLRKRILASPHHVADNLFHHRCNVSWQLRRIYRARNEVIHRAACPPGTPRLLQHLHAYLTGTIEVLMNGLRSAAGGWSIPVALEHRRALFEYNHRLLLSHDGRAISRPALLEPSLVLTQCDGDPAWPGGDPDDATAPASTTTGLPTQGPASARAKRAEE